MNLENLKRLIIKSERSSLVYNSPMMTVLQWLYAYNHTQYNTK
jgi:hypothetical protein